MKFPLGNIERNTQMPDTDEALVIGLEMNQNDRMIVIEMVLP
jgi:hypothetical protein